MKELEKRIKELEETLKIQSEVNIANLNTNEALYEMIVNISQRIDIVKKSVDGSLDIMAEVVGNKIIN